MSNLDALSDEWVFKRMDGKNPIYERSKHNVTDPYLDAWLKAVKAVALEPDIVIGEPRKNSVYSFYNDLCKTITYDPFYVYMGEEKVSLYLLPETGDSLAKGGK